MSSKKSPVAIAGATLEVYMDKPLGRGRVFTPVELVLMLDHCLLLGDFTPQTICRLFVHGADAASVERSLLRFIRKEKDGRRDVLSRIRGVRRFVKYNRKEIKEWGQERTFFRDCVQNGRTRSHIARLFHISCQRADEWAKYLHLVLRSK